MSQLAEVAWLREVAEGDKQALIAAKGAVEASRVAQELAEKKLRPANVKAKGLSDILERREEFFAWKGARTSDAYVEALGSVGAVVPPFVVPDDEDAERAYFHWLEAQLSALSGVME